MSRFPALPSRVGLWLALIVGLTCLLVRHGLEVVAEQEVYLTVSITTDRKTATNPIFIDAQAKFHGMRVLNFTPGTQPHLVHVLMPRGQFQGIYMHFPENEAHVGIQGMWVRNSAGRLNQELPVDFDVRGLHGLEVQRLPNQGGIAFDLKKENPRQAVAIRVPEMFGSPPIRLVPGWQAVFHGMVGGGLALLIAALLKSRGYEAPADLWRLAQAHPRKCICVVGATAALASVLPVFVDQRGFVGPFSGGYILYEADATVPGQGNRILAPSASGTDVAAVLFTALGHMRQAARHLWSDGEILLWDRFNNGGATYIGQGMFLYASPFTWIVLLLGGTMASWTWAFVAVKVVFPMAMGLYLRRIGVSLQVALGAALACGFVGSFIYRTGHFAFFVAGAFPLVLLGMDGVLEPGRRHWKRLPYLICWLLGCLTCFSGGALKEGVFVMASCNALAISLRMVGAEGWRTVLRYFLLALALTTVFVLITAPIWMTFISTLGNYSSIYHDGLVLQKPFGSILSVFDEFFGRIYSERYAQFSPGLNLLFLPGFAFAIVACASGLRRRETLIPVLGALLCLCLVYSVIPGKLLANIEFFSKIFTFYDTFGLTAMPFLIVASARGWDLWLGFDGAVKPAWFNRLAYGLLGLGVGLLAILPLGVTLKRSFPVFLCIGLFLTLMVIWTPALLDSVKRWEKHRLWTRVGLVLGLGIVCAASWVRYGYHTSTALVPWLYVLPERVEGTAESTACEWVRQQVAVQPGRVVGIDQTMTSGTNTFYGLEGVGGAMPLWKPAYHYFLEHLPGGMVEYFWTLHVPHANTIIVAPFLEFLNCRYMFSMPGHDIPGGPDPVHTSDMEVRELPLAWPRAFYINRLERLDDLGALYRRINQRTGPFCSLNSTTLASQPELENLIAEPDEKTKVTSFTPARDYQLTLNSTSFSVEATGAGIIVLHEAFDADAFRVTVNGRPAEPLLVNLMFRGIYVPAAGTYRVEYHYWPRSLDRGLKVAGVGMILLLGMCIGFVISPWQRKLVPEAA